MKKPFFFQDRNITHQMGFAFAVAARYWVRSIRDFRYSIVLIFLTDSLFRGIWKLEVRGDFSFYGSGRCSRNTWVIAFDPLLSISREPLTMQNTAKGSREGEPTSRISSPSHLLTAQVQLLHVPLAARRPLHWRFRIEALQQMSATPAESYMLAAAAAAASGE